MEKHYPAISKCYENGCQRILPNGECWGFKNTIKMWKDGECWGLEISSEQVKEELNDIVSVSRISQLNHVDRLMISKFREQGEEVEALTG